MPFFFWIIVVFREVTSFSINKSSYNWVESPLKALKPGS